MLDLASKERVRKSSDRVAGNPQRTEQTVALLNPQKCSAYDIINQRQHELFYM
jgi:hypothetical protein